MPFVVSMDFGDYKCAKQIIGQLSAYFENIVSLLL